MNARSILDRKCFPTLCATRLLPLLLLLLALPAGLQAQFSYTTNNGAITITGYTGTDPALNIPDTINGLPVTSIADSAFQGSTSLTSVSIPNSVTRVGDYAFEYCTSLTNVVIGNSVTTIGGFAFSYCTGLTSITIPNSVTSVGGEDNGAFGGCTGLTNVVIGNSVTTIGSDTFWGCTSLTRITIPDSVTSINAAAFTGCTSLTSVTIPDSVTNIGGNAFWGCTGLTNVTIGNSVTYLGGFLNCCRLTSIVIPASVKTIGWGTFSMCINLSEMHFQGNAPILEDNNMFLSINATVFHLPGTTGWGATYGGLPTVLWNPQVQTSATSFGVRTNHFGFDIVGTANLVIVVEACTNLTNPTWLPVGTNTLTGGLSYFADSQWTNYPARFYRLRSP